MYGSRYGYGYSSSSFSEGILALMIIGAIAVIALTIFGFIKYLSKKGDTTSKLGRFFNFEHFYLEKILEAFHLFVAVQIVVGAVILPFFTAFSGGGVAGFFIGLIAAIALFFVGLFINRMIYEFALMFVKLVRNSKDLRDHFVPATQEEYQGAIPPTGSVPAGATFPNPPVDADANLWTCACGNAGNKSKFCSRCGKPRP